MIKANLSNTSGITQTEPITQWDFGRFMEITGLDMQQDVEVHFANHGEDAAIIMMGKYEDQKWIVEIPDISLTKGTDVFAFVYESSATSGRTTRRIRIPITKRQKPVDYVAPKTKDYLMSLLEEAERAIAESQKIADEFNESVVGKKTDQGGEIFNDYENNQALAPQSSTHGKNNIAGHKGYHMVGYSKRTVTEDGETYEVVDITVRDLELTEKASEHYVVGDLVNIEANTHLFQQYMIDEIVGTVVANTVITLARVDGQPINFSLDGGGEEEDWLYVFGKNVGEPIPYFTAAFVAGVDSISAGKASFGGGRNNIGSNYALFGGRNNKVGYGGFVAGIGNIITGLYSGSAGWGNVVPYDYCFGSGANNTIEGHYAGFFGNSNKVKDGGFVAGTANEVDIYGACFGQLNKVGYAGLSAGMNNEVRGSYGACFGSANKVGYAGLSAGMNNEVGDYGACFGRGNFVPEGGFGAGEYGYNPDGKYLFFIGNGSEMYRHNLIAVDRNGNLEITGVILESPNGTKFKLVVDDNGTVSMVEVV